MCGSSCKCKECQVDWRDFIRKDNPFLKARNNMNWKFEPSDFLRLYERRPINEFASELANAKLQEWIKDAKVVYRQPGFGGHSWQENLHDASNRTHKALLINIEPIEKCKHEASNIVAFDHYAINGTYRGPMRDKSGITYKCCSCGARVTPSGFEAGK